VKSYFTTSQAARLLSVSPDTVLKWVKAGKLASYRTPGGHYRIPAQAVSSLLPEGDTRSSDVEHASEEPGFVHCWEARADESGVLEACRECPSFTSRARRCYELRADPEAFAKLGLDCPADCADCNVYHLTRDRDRSVLVVSRHEGWTDKLNAQARAHDLELEIATSEYHCGALLEVFRPDYIVIDRSFGASRTREICRHLREDSRLPLPRIVLTSRQARWDAECEGEVCGWIRKPFTMERLGKYIDGNRRPEALGEPVG
jgi:excisionase family DNA binding protein